MKQHKFLYIIVSIFTITQVVSCANLNTQPDDFIAPEYYFNTEEDLDRALTAVYRVLGDRFLYSGADGSLVTVFNTSDEMFNRNGSIVNHPSVYNYSATDAWHDNIWVRIYRGIERANILLANVKKPEMDENKRSIIEGEARFLRAYFHFIAVQNFGAVPLRTTPTASVSDVYNRRVPAADVYRFIYDEMADVESLVPEVGHYEYTSRVTKSVVQGILARVCLHMAGHPNYIEGKYDDALYWAEKVIESGRHRLNPDYSEVFVNLIQDKYDLNESIWEIEFFTTGAGEIYTNRGDLGVIMGIQQTVASYGVSNPHYQVHERLLSKFDIDDLRKDWAICPYRYLNNRAPDRVYWDSTELYNRFIGKFRREYEQVENKSNQNGTNFPLLRYADVLLMAAEAENEVNGPTDKAFSYINKVRRRAYGVGRSLKIDVSATGSGYSEEVPVMVEIVGGNPVNSAGLDPTTAIAVVEDGEIKHINLIHRGTFYMSLPTINIVSDSGDEATATVSFVQNGDVDLSGESIVDVDAFRQVLQDERARELCFEGWRRLDLTRWSILVTTMKDLADHVRQTAPTNLQFASRAGDNISEKHVYFPIPNWEMAVNNQMYQNEGW